MLALLIESPEESVDLSALGYQLLTAPASGAELESVLAQGPELILYAGCRLEPLVSLRARSSLEETPIVILTARASAAERVKLLRAGADDIVSPECIEELQVRLEVLLRSRLAQRRVAEAERELQGLTYAVSHDLQAPLRAVSGFSEVLLNEYRQAFEPEGARLLERVCVNATRMSEMLDGLLELSRLFREPFAATRIDLTTLAVRLFEQLRRRDPERCVELTVADQLPVLADRRLVRILLEQLLDNAWKFTAPNATARIEVGQEESAFFVRDTGVGYESRYAEKLFTPFQRLHGNHFAGRGIGLAKAARIVSRHGGRIWSESLVGSGATFFFTLAASPPQ